MDYLGPSWDIGDSPQADGEDLISIVQQGARSGRSIYVQATGDSAPSTVAGDIVLVQDTPWSVMVNISGTLEPFTAQIDVAGVLQPITIAMAT